MALCQNCHKKVAVASDLSQIREEMKLFRIHASKVEWAKNCCWRDYFPDRKCHEQSVHG